MQHPLQFAAGPPADLICGAFLFEYVPIAPPCRRHASELVNLSHRHISMIERDLVMNRLPEAITDAAGTIICPPRYALPSTSKK
jgi:hypothetical protein